MAIIRARNPLRWVRRALLALGILSLSVCGLLLAAYQFGNAGRREAVQAPPSTTANVDDRTVTAGQGFDYTQTSEGQRVFRIRADRSRQDREDWAYLEEVQLEIYRENGEVSTVTSRRARVHQQTWNADLEGDVVLRGWEDLELRARALEIRDGARVLISVGAVQFDYPPTLTGRATRLRIDRGADAIQLSEGVHIRSTEDAETPLRMDCDRMIYRRAEGLIRAFDDVYFRFGGQELETQALSLFLEDPNPSEAGGRDATLTDGDGLQVRRLRARWDVRGRLAAIDAVDGPYGLDSQQAEFFGQFLEIEPNPDNPELRNVRLEGRRGIPASIKIVAPDGLARSLTGRRLESRLRNGVLEVVEGGGKPLRVEEFLDLEEPYRLRQACARQARARFLSNGRLGRVELWQNVELRDEDLYLSGGTNAVLDLERGHLEIEGPAVELYNQRGVFTAPRFTYARDRGVLQADAGVTALLESTAAFARTPLGSGEGPVRVEAREATWTDDPRTFAFRGAVRAWRGQNLLLSDQLRGDEEAREMAASGRVKTVWIPSAATTDTSRRAPIPAAEPIEVTSDLLSYRFAEPSAAPRTGPENASLVYSGNVEVRQAAQILRCRELTLEMAGGTDREVSGTGEPRRMICREQVHLVDALGSREVRGDTAVYTVDRRRVEIYGEEVRLTDASGNTLTGQYLLYDLDADSVELRSRGPRQEAPGR